MIHEAPSGLSSAKEEKILLRKRIRQAERLLDDAYIQKSGDVICRRLLSLDEYKKASSVFCFASMPRELPTGLFLRQALTDGKQVCVPVCRGDGIMDLKQIFSLSDLVPGHFGIPEPGPLAPSVDPRQIAFAVVPCLTCSMSGGRLGRGGGYYDRFLSDYRGFAVMICMDRLISDRIPLEEHDIRIPNVITEERMALSGTAGC